MNDRDWDCPFSFNRPLNNNSMAALLASCVGEQLGVTMVEKGFQSPKSHLDINTILHQSYRFHFIIIKCSSNPFSSLNREMAGSASFKVADPIRLTVRADQCRIGRHVGLVEC